MENSKKYIKNKQAYLQLIGDEIKNSNSNVTPRIILTVPHSYCIVIDNIRTCDRLAEKFASTIDLKLKERKIDTERIMSDQSRYQLDDNRFISLAYGTPFWQKLATILKSNQIKKLIVLDIHSFPNGEREQSSFEINPTKNQDIVILANKPYNQLSRLLASILNSDIFDAKTGSNSVIDTMGLFDIPATLLEIRESIDDIKIDHYAGLIADYIEFVYS